MYRPRCFEELDVQPTDQKVSWFIATPLLALVIGAVWFCTSALPSLHSKNDAASNRAADPSTRPQGSAKVVSR